jgi:DNA repair protein RecO (recombination protein O)
MPQSHITSAIVLRTRPFGESDKIVSFLTEDLGKVTGIAKGAKRSRRRFANSLEPFSVVNLHVREQPHAGLLFIVAADLQFGFKRLLGSLEKISLASYMVEITEGLIPEREENRPVFRHLNEGLRYLEDNDASLRFLTLFELKLLRLTGYQPLLDRCKECGKHRRDDFAGHWQFSPREGGVLCRSCSPVKTDLLPLGATASEVLLDLQSENSPTRSRILLPLSVVREIRSVLLRFIQFHVDREIKSASFLSEFAPVYSARP